jgi:hypothetical protein
VIELVYNVVSLWCQAYTASSSCKGSCGISFSLEGLSREQVQELVDNIYGSAQYTVQDAPIDPWGPLVSNTFVECLGSC